MSKKINFVTDKEIILDNKNDLLSTKVYADNLKNVILNIPEDAESSFTIGLFGEWGSGKSSIINTVKDELEKDSKFKIKFIIYDAWKYANDSFRRTLLLKLQEDLKFDKTKLLKSFYINESEDVDIKRKFNLGYSILVVIFSIVALILVLGTDFSTDLKITIPILFSLVGFIAVFFKKAFDEFKVTIQKPHLFAPEQFEECFKEITQKAIKKYSKLEKLQKWVTGDNHLKDIDLLIIVIDNIDRCHKELAYVLLTNIKNFLGKDKNIVFIIPVDDKALKKHIESTSNDSDTQEACEFLRKIFNIVIRLKLLKRYDIYAFAKKINDKYSLNFAPDTIDVIGKEYASNPRRIIQFYNNLVTEMDNFDKDFIRENETAICKMLILEEEWPVYFKKLCRNTYLLNEPNQEIENIINGDTRLQAFLKKTKPITQGIEPKVLSKILLNKDDLSNIPDSIIGSIQNLNYEEICTFYSDDIKKSTLVIDYLIEDLKTFIESNRNTAALNNFQVLVALNEKKAFDKSINRRIQNEIYFYLLKLLENWSYKENLLVKYSENLYQQNLKYLKDFLISTAITEYKEEKEYAEIKAGQKSILRSMIKTYTDASSFKSLQEAFYKEYVNNEDFISDFEIDAENLVHIISNEMLNYILSNIVKVDNEDLALNDLVYLSKYIKIGHSTLDSIFEKINTIYPNFTNQSKEVILNIVLSLNSLLPNISPTKYKYAQLQTLYTNIFAPRTFGGKNIIFAQEIIVSNEELDVCLEFLYQVYRITEDSIPTLNEFKELFSSDYAKSRIKLIMLKLKIKHRYSLFPLYDIILTDNTYDKQSLELLEYIFIYKDNEEYKLSQDQLDSKLAELLNLTIGENTNIAIAPFLESLLNNERITNSLIGLITKKNKNDILSLTEKLQQLAFDYICQDNRLLNDYKDEQELLMAIAQNGKAKYIKALTNVLIEKLVHNEYNYAFQIIDCVSNFSKSDKAKIAPYLKEHISNEDMGKFAKNALDKINGTLKTKSIFDIEDEQQKSEHTEGEK